MPGGDGTGPLGLGPMTGRRGGFCAGYNRPLYGQRFGRGRRFWQTNSFNPAYNQSPVEERAYLEDLIKNLEEQIKALKDRVQDLAKDKKE